MGIPAYFSYIIKNHVQILKNLLFVQSTIQFDHLYMDCNSIIYDTYHEILLSNKNPSFDEIIDKTIQNIQTIVTLISPTKTVYIAFDGVAPLAKMKQQRLRRYRTLYVDKTSETNVPIFNTTMITPGTRFMKRLSVRLHEVFDQTEYIITTADEPGEGEHKMMQHMRDHPDKDGFTAIYGLDSDLIMLAIYHQHLYKHIFIFREAQEFFKSRIPIKFSHAKEPYFMDISELIQSIANEMRINGSSFETTIQTVYDYVFLCFMIGNDFLPHFPMVNIRTHGIQILLDTYYNLPTKYKKLVHFDLTSLRSENMQRYNKPTIHWPAIAYLIENLAKNEHELFVQEYNHREKQSCRFFPETTSEEKEVALSNSPIQFRGEEMYISPQINGWEKRYYKALFHTKNPNKECIQKICVNYLEGLEWVFDYYTTGCTDWQWKYEYDYPPLFRDLCMYIPTINTRFIHEYREPSTIYQQLTYVLPAKQQFDEGIITDEMCRILSIQEKSKLHYGWAFCKYLWEAHLTV
jgi:5'-3' exonuclease